ncbi:hypothetical protein JCM10908_002014 [Rhodotorula pacifica]|uniref:uncharacterized protein n=1 Tax=Rhodotorula pacifica TaxID=1495444 RepID=UPI003175F1DF
MDFAALRAKAEQAAHSARAQLQQHSTSTSSNARPSYPRAGSSTSAATPGSSRLAAPTAPPHSAPRSSTTTTFNAKPSRATPLNDATSDKEKGKQALFSALDEFFSTRFGVQVQPVAPAQHVPTPPPRAAPKPAAAARAPTIPSARAAEPSIPAPPPRSLKPPGPPPVSRATRPKLPSSVAHTSTTTERSYPPRETHSSAALSLLHWLLDPSDFSTATAVPFFLPPPANTSPQPPPLQNRSDVRSAFSWMQRGDEKTYMACFLFGDASIAWIRLAWNATSERRGTTQLLREVKREGRYRPRPRIERDWDADRLYAASEMYGPRIVRFAENALAGGVPVARGECWDLANEALRACEAEWSSTEGGRKPFPSIARTHGALLYYANAGTVGRRDPATGKVLGEWIGGDVYVRPGDIVEWRSVRIREVGMGPGSYSTLGDPEHTALILSAGEPLSLPSFASSSSSAANNDGSPFLDTSYPLSSLVSLTVVEQSRGFAPQLKTYDLAAMSEGEVWIYRPCGLRELVGTEDVGARWPPEVQSWQIAELE